MPGTLEVGQELPTYRVRARNLAAASENPIHDDAVARRYGYAAGLVAGITTLAYMTHPVVEALGRRWLERGSLEARLRRPLYDGDRVEVRARVREAGGKLTRVDVEAVNAAGELCAEGSASLPAVAPPGPDPAAYRAAALPPERPPATPETVRALDVLGTVRRLLTAREADGFLEAIGEGGEPLGLYRDEELAHPGWLLYDANQALARNVALGPWVHAATRLHNLEVVHRGDEVATWGRVARAYERRGRQWVDLDLLMVGAGGRPVAHVLQTAVYGLGLPGAPGCAPVETTLHGGTTTARGADSRI